MDSFRLLKIYYKYTDYILNDPRCIIAFYCIDQEFCIYNCPSILVYRKQRYDNVTSGLEIRYYVLFTCTSYKFRGQGYGSKLLDEFQKRIREECAADIENHIDVKIILSSIEESVLFYEAYGFRWTRENIKAHPLLMRYENYEEGKEYFIMELVIKNE